MISARHGRRPAFPLAAAVLLGAVAAAGCSKCAGAKSAAGPALTRYVPRAVEGAAVVPDLGVLGDRLTQLQGMKLASFAAQLRGFPTADAFVNALVQQAGVDLRSRESMKTFGLAPERGLAVALLPDNQAYAVVGVGDASAFAASLEKLARTRLGAGTVHRETVNGLEHVWFSRVGTRPELGYVRVKDFALIASGATTARLPEFAALSEENSLSKEPALQSALKRLPARRDLFLYAPASSKPGLHPKLRGLTATVALDPEALRVRVDAPWPDSPQTLAALEPEKGPALAWQLPEDAFAVVRYAGDPARLEPLWPMIAGPFVQRAFAAAKLDVKQEILSNLQPGMVASLSVSPNIPLGSGMPELDVRRTNPFRYAQLVALARATDASKVAPLLARLPDIAPGFGAQIEPVKQGERTLYTTRYAQGEGVHFALARDGLVVFASPLGRLEKALARVASGSSSAGPAIATDPSLKAALENDALAAVIDLDQLRTSVRALPPEAWGIGGFAIKASAVRWLEATDELRAITLGVSRKDSAVQAELALRFSKK